MNSSEIQDRYLAIVNQINSVCFKNQIDASTVQLLVVSKKQSIEKIKFVFGLGQKYFGENYVQEAIDKQESLSGVPIQWHFIGHLQRNKVKDVVGNFEMIHSVDSMELANKISQKAIGKNINQKILLELNIANEESKGGFSKERLESEFKKIVELPGIVVSGLMVLPPSVSDSEQVRPYFREAKFFFTNLSNQLSIDQKQNWKFLSMGTTQDFSVAIQEGSNIVRLGTAIFGERE